MGMFNKVIISMCDECVKKLTMERVCKVLPGTEVIDGSKDMEIFYHLQNPDDNVLLIFDRLFMGYILKYKMEFLRSINPRMKIIFVETGFCVLELGLRLWEVGADGFICEIEDEKIFNTGINKIISGAKYFPEIVHTDVKTGNNQNNRRVSLELTDSEYIVGVYLGKGYTLKEISYATNIPYSTVKTSSSVMKRKIGFKSANDLMILNQRLAIFNIRSWAC